MRRQPREATWLLAAGLLAVAIFAIDSIAGFDVSISILYIVVLALVARSGRAEHVRRATAATIALAGVSWVIVHGRDPEIASGLRLIFAWVAILITNALLLSRQKLRRLQAELEESRAELINFTDTVPHLLWRADVQGKVEYYNLRYTELTGHDRDEAVANQSWVERFHPSDLAVALETFERSISTGAELRGQLRMMHADGNYRWMMFQGRPYRSPETGEILRWYGGTSDVHEEVLAQQQVRELMNSLEDRVAERTAELLRTEARYASLFEVSNMTFAEMDFSDCEPILADIRHEGVTDLRRYMLANPLVLDRCLAAIRTTRVNAALARLLGYESPAELAANPLEQNAADGRDIQLRQLEMAYAGIDHIDGRTVLNGKDGRRVPVYFTVNRLPDGVHLSSHVDLSEQERIEELRLAAQKELARANRVATVGALSASIAHELNQPIAAMVTDAHTGLRFLREQQDTTAAARVLERMARTSGRVAAIVQRTRDSIVAGRRAQELVDLGQLAEDTRQLLERDIMRSGVALDLVCVDPVPPVRGDRVDLQQVLVNLVTNAADALRDWAGERRITISIAHAHGLVRASVSDTGPGFDEAQRDRLFEPFFTTKVDGIGMGLQICRSAIDAMGGEFEASNQSGGGALFSFGLPVAEVERSLGEDRSNDEQRKRFDLGG